MYDKKKLRQNFRYYKYSILEDECLVKITIITCSLFDVLFYKFIHHLLYKNSWEIPRAFPSYFVKEGRIFITEEIQLEISRNTIV